MYSISLLGEQWALVLLIGEIKSLRIFLDSQTVDSEGDAASICPRL